MTRRNEALGRLVDLLGSARMRGRRRCVVLTLWVLIVSTWVIICVRHSGIEPYLNHYQSQLQVTSPPENQINGFTCYRYDPSTYKLRFAASVGSLRAENATLGIFKTAAAKVIKVKDMQLHFCEYPGSSPVTTLQGNALPEESAGDKTGLEEILAQLGDTRGYWRVNVNIDLSNACGVAINNFDCRMFDDGALRLAVQSRRAVADLDRPQITLRGHVIITAADGSTLESNHIRWDTQKQRFIADGTYFLRRGESRTSGKGICVDSQLNNTVWEQSAKGKERSRGKWLFEEL